MKKETVIAIFLGLVFGSLLGFFLITKNKEEEIKKNKTIAPTGLLTEKKTSANQKINFQPLEITDPNDSSIIDKNLVVLRGKATKNALIVVQSPIKDIVYKNKTENFSLELPLALGENVIKIVVYPEDKTFSIQEKTLHLYFIKEL